jgi:hypothetical protein
MVINIANNILMDKKHATKKGGKSSAIRNEYLGEVLAPYENKWVALSTDLGRVIASGDSLQDVDGKLNEKERIDAVFHKVLPFEAAYVPLTIA